jgi:hypothetical protein
MCACHGSKQRHVHTTDITPPKRLLVSVGLSPQGGDQPVLQPAALTRRRTSSPPSSCVRAPPPLAASPPPPPPPPAAAAAVRARVSRSCPRAALPSLGCCRPRRPVGTRFGSVVLTHAKLLEWRVHHEGVAHHGNRRSREGGGEAAPLTHSERTPPPLGARHSSSFACRG